MPGAVQRRDAGRQADAAVRDAEIVRLRREGMSSADIGRRFNLSRQRINMIYKRALEQPVAAEVAELRAEQSQRLDAIAAELWKVLRATGTDPPAAVSALRTLVSVEERRARLFGLDAPQRTEISIEQVRYEVVAVDLAKLA